MTKISSFSTKATVFVQVDTQDATGAYAPRRSTPYHDDVSDNGSWTCIRQDNIGKSANSPHDCVANNTKCISKVPCRLPANSNMSDWSDK